MSPTPNGDWFVRAPASSANLGAGFDVLGLALEMYADCGVGLAPSGAQQLDEHHPGRKAFDVAGGSGPIWLRCNIPMGRGLGFSGAVRVAAVALAMVQQYGPDVLVSGGATIVSTAAELEGHGDNVAASFHGGVTAYVDGACVQVPVGPTIADASFVAWVPEVTTSTDRSRRSLEPTVDRADAVHNIGRSIQFVMAVVNDDPSMLAAGTADRMHQAARLALVAGAPQALEAGLAAGAWAGWLSGSGPTVAFICAPDRAAGVVSALPEGGHAKAIGLDVVGCCLVSR